MDPYDTVAQKLSRQLTEQYSTSFSTASRLFSHGIRQHVYNIYGLVRIADEIVDTYPGTDKAILLNSLEQETYAAMERGFSSNPLVHAFALTARKYAIDQQLIQPFFESMRMDIQPATYDQKAYEQYIYGSAEVVGLMCLRVFCEGDSAMYTTLAPGAQRLGAAYQKVNFLRDLAADHNELGRFYFPNVTYDTFSEAAKQAVIADITTDFTAVLPYIRALPAAAKPAVMTSYRYYCALLGKLQSTPLERIKKERIRVSAYKKALLLAPQAARVRR